MFLLEKEANLSKIPRERSSYSELQINSRMGSSHQFKHLDKVIEPINVLV